MKKNWTSKIELSKKQIVEFYPEEGRQNLIVTLNLSKKDKELIQKLRAGDNTDTQFVLNKKLFDFEMVVDPTVFKYKNGDKFDEELEFDDETWINNSQFLISFLRFTNKW